MMQCDVSVIIPHYNSLSTLIRAVNSVFEQKLLPKQIIIIDDGSERQEKLLLVLQEKYASFLENRTLILYCFSSNQGVSAARNMGVELAIGQYIAFLDCDDVWHPKKLLIQYQMMDSLGLDFSFHNYVSDISKHKLEINQVTNDKLSLNPINKYIFIFTNPIATPTVMVKKAKFLQFNSQLRRMEDFECWVKNSNIMTLYKLNYKLAGGFKSPIGYSGLSGNIKAMHQDLLISLKSLYRQHVISNFFYWLATSIECVKYPLRVLKIKLVKQ